MFLSFLSYILCSTIPPLGTFVPGDLSERVTYSHDEEKAKVSDERLEHM